MTQKINLLLALVVIIFISLIFGTFIWVYSVEQKEHISANHLPLIQPEACKETEISGLPEKDKQEAQFEESKKLQQMDRVEFLDTTYKNEKYGFELKYPALIFHLSTQSAGCNTGCFRTKYPNGIMANQVPKIETFNISVLNSNNESLNDIKRKLTKEDKINATIVYLRDDMVNPSMAIRYEFDGVPKQSPSGYGYILGRPNRRMPVDRFLTPGTGKQCSYSSKMLHAGAFCS